MGLERAGIADWSPHSEAVDVVAERLASDVDNGLSEDEASRRLGVFGPNSIREQPPPGKWLLLARQFRDPLVLVLVVAASISGLVLGDVLEAMVIVAIVVLNAAIGFIQEVKAADAAESLRRMATPHARVIRSGDEALIPTVDIVPGDLVDVAAGDRIPADARLITAIRLEVDESELTGESQAVEKDVYPAPAEAGVGDRSSMILSGTVVSAGRGSAMVTATGDDTEIGRIAGLLREAEPRTPLERELGHVGRRLGVLAGVVALVVLVVGVVQGREPESMFLLAVALAVAAIPEGLPTVVAVTLSSGVQRMARHRAIVRKLQAVEALGAATVICTDKTGTLTRNQIEAREICVRGGRPGDIRALPPGGIANRFAEVAILCSDARQASEEWLGDPTEVALLRAASAHADVAAVRSEWTRVDEIPFDATRKRMTTLNRRDGVGLIAVKGAPEIVLDLCSKVEAGDGPVAMDDSDRMVFLGAAEEMAGRGLRTMALAYEETAPRPPHDLDDAGEGLVLVGVVGMSDALRPEARPSVEEAMRAGVRVVMISGDHEVTTRAIAADLGLLDGGRVMGGAELRSIDDVQLGEQVEDIVGYARVDPEDKVRIVRAWQARGETVAMTGDGVNDAPALHIADIGVAMGSGTDVARDAADIVLADDNFATIVSAIGGGRTIFANIRKVIGFLLAANVSEVIVVLVGFLLFGAMGEPLLATQILFVNLVTDGLPAVALGFDPPDSRVMLRPPRRTGDLLDRSSQGTIALRGLILATATLAGFAYGIVQELDWAATRTIGFTTLVLVQLTFVYALRVAESGWRDGLARNRFLHGAVLLSVSLQVLVVSTPLGNQLFATTSLALSQWIVVVLLAVVASLVVIALSRWTSSRRERRDRPSGL